MHYQKIIINLILLSFLITGCQVFPYVFDPGSETPTVPSILTATPQPTHTTIHATATPENTPTADITTEEPTTEPSPEVVIQFTIQDGSPFYMPNFAQPSAGCNWMGVAGQVFDEQNHEIQELLVVIGNALDEGDGEWSAITGAALAYGPGGFEIQLSDAPIDTTQTFWIEIRTPNGTLISERFLFDTFSDCERNLILINFISN